MSLQTSVINPPIGLPVPQVLYLPLDRIDESPTNPRKRFDDLAELAASIQDHGVETPIRITPRGERYLAIGGARRIRASKLAGKTDIPAIVEEDIDDHLLLMRQLEDNANRKDPHPLEEALAYKRALDDGWSVKDLAQRLGKPASTIYSALKMCELIGEAQDLCFSGGLTSGHAVQIARLSPHDQRRALAYCKPSWDPDREISVRSLGDWIKQNCHLNLTRASFDPADANLLPLAGACTVCPKRSGANPELFSDIENPNTCTDPECFNNKARAAEELRIKNEPPPEPPPALASPEPPKPKTKPAVDPEVRKREIEAQRKREEAEKRYREEREAAARRGREEEQRNEKVFQKTLDVLLEKISWPITQEDFASIFTFMSGNFESVNQLAERFAIPKKNSWRDRDIASAAAKMSPAKQVRMAIAGMLLDLEYSEVGENRYAELNRFAKRYKVDQAAIRAAVDAELNPKKPEPDPRKEVIGKLSPLAASTKPAPKKTLDAATRQKIAEEHKKRWAEHRRQQAGKAAPKKKGGKK